MHSTLCCVCELRSCALCGGPYVLPLTQSNPWGNLDGSGASAWGEGGDDAEAPSDYATGKTATIFLIDAGETMRAAGPDGTTCLDNAVRVVLDCMTNKIIGAQKDLIGVCFYSSAKKKNENEFEGVNEFLELEAPSASAIRQLQGIVPGERDEGSSEAVEAAKKAFDAEVC